jgi:hypothetical protein
VAATRISLDSVVYSFNEGNLPEAINEDFPSRTRAQIYGAIAFYLDRQAEVDEYMVRTEREFEEAPSHCSRRIRHFGRSWSVPAQRLANLALEPASSSGRRP